MDPQPFCCNAHPCWNCLFPARDQRDSGEFYDGQIQWAIYGGIAVGVGGVILIVINWSKKEPRRKK